MSKDHITLLLCVNVSGDYITKPMLFYRSLNPRALKAKDKDKLPIFWRLIRKLESCLVYSWIGFTIALSLRFKIPSKEEYGF